MDYYFVFETNEKCKKVSCYSYDFELWFQKTIEQYDHIHLRIIIALYCSTRIRVFIIISTSFIQARNLQKKKLIFFCFLKWKCNTQSLKSNKCVDKRLLPARTDIGTTISTFRTVIVWLGVVCMKND